MNDGGLHWNQRMPCLSNPDHENAAQHLARRQSLSPEHRSALGLKPSASLQEEAAALGGLNVKGKSFKANARKFCQRTIGRRVAEIQRVAADVAGITIVSLSEHADEIRLGAVEDRDWGAARACVETIAKLNGLWRDKVALTDPSGDKPGVVRFIVENAPESPVPSA